MSAETPTAETRAKAQVRPLDTVDIGAIVEIDEALTGEYRPERWERRIGYYLRREPDATLVVEVDGSVVGFMFGEVRSGEFGLEEPTGWIEVLGVHPDHRGQRLGRLLAEAMLSHFRARGAKAVRTLVDEGMPGIAGFFSSLGFGEAPLKAYVMRFPEDSQ